MKEKEEKEVFLRKDHEKPTLENKQEEKEKVEKVSFLDIFLKGNRSITPENSTKKVRKIRRQRKKAEEDVNSINLENQSKITHFFGTEKEKKVDSGILKTAKRKKEIKENKLGTSLTPKCKKWRGH